jgi:hypothetical protein
MALDLPDWSRQAFSGLQLLATISCPNPPGGCLQNVTIRPETRSLFFVWSAPSGSDIDVEATELVTGIKTGHVTLYGGIGQITQVVGSLMVDAHIGATWQISGSASGTGNGTLYVFSSAEAWSPYNPAAPMPIAYSDGQQYRIGQQAMLQSLPVVIASDQLPPAASSVAYVGQAITLPRTVVGVVTPPAGKSVLILGVTFSISSGTTGFVDMFLTDASVNVYALSQGMSVGGTAVYSAPIPAGGVKLPSNTQLQFSVQGSSAAGQGQTVVYYMTV